MAFNVLIVDDSAVMRTMVRRTLCMAGLALGEIHEAAHGVEALALLQEHWIDVALLDVNMPVMNGEELVRRLRADVALASIAIVVVSTERSETRIAALRALGAEFIPKPFAPETLRDVILRITGEPDDHRTDDRALQGSSSDF